MGFFILNLNDYEEKVKLRPKSYTMIIVANAHSDSKAVEYVLRNFTIMDILSADVDFYIPGYNVDDLRNREVRQISECENQSMRARLDDYHGPEDDLKTTSDMVGYNRTFVKIIDSPRFGNVRFNDAAYAISVMDLQSMCPHYRYTGVCQLNLIPMLNGSPDYSCMRSYDLDAIVACREGLSLEAFFHRIIGLIRFNNGDAGSSNHDIFTQIDALYSEATVSVNPEQRADDTYSRIVSDIEECLQWSLNEEFFFISYSSSNVMKAELLKRRLMEKGCRVWIAPDGIPQGRDYSMVIPTAVNKANHFILLLTPDSAKSNWVRRELNYAINNEPHTKVKVLLADGYSVAKMRNNPNLLFCLDQVQIRYSYDEVINNPEILEKFINE